jgi:hypothetical protein
VGCGCFVGGWYEVRSLVVAIEMGQRGLLRDGPLIFGGVHGARSVYSEEICSK